MEMMRTMNEVKVHTEVLLPAISIVPSSRPPLKRTPTAAAAAPQLVPYLAGNIRQTWLTWLKQSPVRRVARGKRCFRFLGQA